MNEIENLAIDLNKLNYSINSPTSKLKITSCGFWDRTSQATKVKYRKFSRYIIHRERIKVLEQRHCCIHNLLYILDEISIETDPIGCVEGYIKAWKDELKKITKDINNIKLK